MPSGTIQSKRRVDKRALGSLKLDLHNAIQSLKSTPVGHVKMRDRLEYKINEFVVDKEVPLSEALKDMLLSANPSDILIRKLFPDPSVDMSNPKDFYSWHA
jgi:hypothetical protein